MGFFMPDWENELPMRVLEDSGGFWRGLGGPGWFWGVFGRGPGEGLGGPRCPRGGGRSEEYEKPLVFVAF